MQSCQKSSYCHDLFKDVSVRVIGPVLQDYYTIRFATGDTLRFIDTYDPINFGGEYYTVFDQSKFHLIKGRKENFIFIGILADTVAVVESYYLSADECSFRKLHGKDEIIL
jgi:hypothetical protein